MIGLRSGRRRASATAEFLARCALATHRRYLPEGGRGKARPAPEAPARATGPDALADALSALGVRRGGILMLHSDSGACARMGWEPSSLIDFLRDYLGPDGTLAMPTHPKLSRQGDRLVYDVRRSPSKVGLITELFRRRKGVIRSQFPFSAAAACGPLAEALMADHRRSFAPHDEHSPYAKLADLGGQVLTFGCPLNRMTILHVAEDVLRGSLPIEDFHRPCEVWVKAGDEAVAVTAHVRAPWLWWYLHLSGWAREMYHRGLARTHRLSGVLLQSAEARQTVDWMKDELRAGRPIYPLAPLNRWLRLGDPRAERDDP